MRLKRLLGMSLEELATRTHQEASKWLEPWTRFHDEAPQVTLGSLRPGDFLAQAPTRFFAGATSAEVPRLLRERMPAEASRILKAAESLTHGRFDLLGYRGLDFGDPLDWHLDPLRDRHAPRIPWGRIDPLDPQVVGDSKVIWELSRHQWLVTLGQAYRLTGEEHYARTFAREVSAWMEENPGGVGINWASSLEVALRLMAWCWALLLFHPSPALTPDLLTRLLGGLASHASHVERYLSTYFSPNTHLTGEALGLFYAGTLLRGSPAARRWRETGAAILAQQLDRQVLKDGVYFEQATCYERYTVEIGLHLFLLNARAGEAPAALGDRLQLLLDFLLYVRRPDGSMPAIGDADGGWLLPLVPGRAPDDLRGLFAVAAALFRRPDYAWAAQGAAPELLWLLGPRGLKAFEALTPAPPAGSASRLFGEGGYAVMASGWGESAHRLVVDAGPLGCADSGGHGHADLLSLELSAFGEPYLVDPGTFLYTPEPAWRNYFRSTQAHTALVVDGESQARPAGPFAWRERPRATIRRWLSEPEVDYLDAEHDAYERLSDPVRHRRRLVFVKPRYWVLLDDLQGAGEHGFELSFQLAPMKVEVEGDLWVRARGGKGSALLLKAFANVPLRVEIHEGETGPIRGWVAPDYGRRRAAPQVVFRGRAPLPARVLTLLLPLENPDTPPPLLHLLGKEQAPTGLHFPGTGERLWVVDEGPGAPVRREGGGRT